MNRKFNWRITVVLGAILCLPFMVSNVSAQTNDASETDVAQSMGVGLKVDLPRALNLLSCREPLLFRGLR